MNEQGLKECYLKKILKILKKENKEALKALKVITFLKHSVKRFNYKISLFAN